MTMVAAGGEEGGRRGAVGSGEGEDEDEEKGGARRWAAWPTVGEEGRGGRARRKKCEFHMLIARSSVHYPRPI